MNKFKNILLIAIILIGAVNIFLNTTDTLASAIDSESLMMKINQERTNRNIPALVTSPKLAIAATSKTRDMFERGYFDHVDPDGRYVWFRVEDAGYWPYKTLGENLAIDFSTEEGIVRAWINSPSHRDNLLNAVFADQGLFAQYGDYENRYTSIITSLFGTLAAVTPALQPSAQASSQPPPSVDTSQAVPSVQDQNSPIAADTQTNQTRFEPAIMLSQISQAPPNGQGSSTFATVVPTGFSNFDKSAYSALRFVFIFLVLIFILTIFIDSIRRRKASQILSRNLNSSILLALVLACLFTINLY
ncbi:MAG: CAP domain-containing protein [Patescibacteria group bacterium]